MSEKRLFQEYKQLRKTPASKNNHQILELAPKDPENSINEWYAVIAKPSKTDSPYYYNGKWTLNIAAGAEYPRQPPKISFCRKTKINHPNINLDTGEICLDILKSEAWSPAWNLAHLVGAVLMLLDEPEPDSPLNVDSANLYRSDKVAFESAVQYTMWRENTFFDGEKKGSGAQKLDSEVDCEIGDLKPLKEEKNRTAKGTSNGKDHGMFTSGQSTENEKGSAGPSLLKSLDNLVIESAKDSEKDSEKSSQHGRMDNFRADSAKRPADNTLSPESSVSLKDGSETASHKPHISSCSHNSIPYFSKSPVNCYQNGPYGKHSKTNSETDLEYIHSIGRHITEEFIKKANEVQIACPSGNDARNSSTSSQQMAAVHEQVSNNVAKQIEEICSRNNSCSQSPTYETYGEKTDVKSAEELFREKIEQQVDQIRRLRER